MIKVRFGWLASVVLLLVIGLGVGMIGYSLWQKTQWYEGGGGTPQTQVQKSLKHFEVNQTSLEKVVGDLGIYAHGVYTRETGMKQRSPATAIRLTLDGELHRWDKE